MHSGGQGSDPDWPSEDDLLGLKGRLQGSLYIPCDDDYTDSADILNQLYSNTPAIVVEPQTDEDVRKAVLFAQQYNLKPSVASTGHDLIGRSSGNGTLHINLRHMKQFDVITEGEDSPYVVSGPGNTHIEMIEWLDSENYVMVGAYCPTVGIAGFSMGGGWGPITSLHGFGVDNVLHMTLVTAEGDIVDVYPDRVSINHPDGTNELEQDEDLFWALRGGNGGTFAIVTRISYKIHPAPEYYVLARTSFYMDHPDIVDYPIGELIADFMDWSKTKPAKASAAFVLNTIPYVFDGVTVRQHIDMDVLYSGPWDEAWPHIRDMVEYQPTWQIQSQPTLLNVSLFDLMNIYLLPDNHFTVYSFNKHLQESDMDGREQQMTIAEALLKVKDYDVAFYCPLNLFGGDNSKTREYSDDSTSISPDLRNGGNYLCYGYPSQDNLEGDVAKIRQHSLDIYPFGSGVYPNEADYHIEDFASEFWGDTERYGRLVAVKNKWDPHGMFQCHHCVGSDMEDAGSQFRTVPDDVIQNWDCGELQNQNAASDGHINTFSCAFISFFLLAVKILSKL